ncbi:hypothetical protein DOTSEDRAFT_163305 [Dothistroma septosporum NZE10]|uniref:Peptidase S54 rhomboid domain-containing protein n=1 Tax=Dothistroma septosporum (strain NZE10 / CBS 128990) TaxID=675120 RepID=N1Q098_DOTSN|nr:hypothetical protein DOTSEDRAFT_163305 [Dothistroma septosporum NZE10]
MDAISPAQHEQVQKWLAHASLRHRPHHPIDITTDIATEDRRSWPKNDVAFAFLGALNVPAFLKAQMIKVHATKQAIDSWTRWSADTFSGRWTSETLEWLGAKDKIIAANSHMKGTLATYEWIHRFGLSPTSPLYTWLTNGFIHLDASHLISNMIGLVSVAPICSRVPGMTPSHVFAITIGSSICASAAQVTEWKFRVVPGHREAFMHAIGASGIVKAFIAVAAAGAREEPVTLFGISVPCWIVGLLSIAGDVAGLLRLDELMVGKRKSWLDAMRQPRIGYAAHLGGAAFGLIYYYAMLRPRTMSCTASTNRPIDPAPS